MSTAALPAGRGRRHGVPLVTGGTIEGPRHALQLVLAAVWLLDAALQYQPTFFGPSLARDVIAPSGPGSPGWVAGPVHWTAGLVAGAPAVWNAVFATLQLVIALGLLSRRTVRPALALSFVWALGLWWLAEGLGGVLAGPVLPADGFPGAAVLYAVLAVALWPARASAGPDDRSVAERSPLRRTGAVAVWVLLWAAMAFEALRPADRSPTALHDLVAGGADGEPGCVRAVERWGAAGLAGHGTEVSIASAVVFVLVALLGIAPVGRRPALIVAGLVGVLFFVFGEAFGTIATGTATDPDSGLLLVLLAAAFWPRPAAAVPG